MRRFLKTLRESAAICGQNFKGRHSLSGGKPSSRRRKTSPLAFSRLRCSAFASTSTAALPPFNANRSHDTCPSRLCSASLLCRCCRVSGCCAAARRIAATSRCFRFQLPLESVQRSTMEEHYSWSQRNGVCSVTSRLASLGCGGSAGAVMRDATSARFAIGRFYLCTSSRPHRAREFQSPVGLNVKKVCSDIAADRFTALVPKRLNCGLLGNRSWFRYCD